MKKIVITIACLLVSLLGQARQVTEQEARQKAQQFLQGRQLTEAPLSGADISGPAKAPRSQAYYVFNVEANGGFVIVAGDDRMTDILGYAAHGRFDLDAAPDNVRWLLELYEQVATAPEHADGALLNPRRQLAEIAPLLTTTWGQDGLYSSACPTSDGQTCLTGCVATAMAQVMNYVQWPQGATKAIPAYTSTATHANLDALPSTTFDWSNMTDDAIAQLMRYCGQAVKMDYTTAESGAVPTRVPAVLDYFFGYDADVHNVFREHIADDRWEALLYDELAAGRPVIYSGWTYGYEGHTFVVHGYRDGLFYVNWGWDGLFDGYFALTHLAPTQWQEFTQNQVAVVGIQPGGSTSTPTFDPSLKVVNVAEPGTLPQLIGDAEKLTITSLALTGYINGTDLRFLREMMGSIDDEGWNTDGQLSTLDLSHARIMEGGLPYQNNPALGFQRRDAESDEMGVSLFQQCSMLHNIVLPRTAAMLNDNALSVSHLESVVIPAALTQLGRDIFYYCTVDALTVDADNPAFDSRDDCNALIETATNTLLIGTHNTVIPGSVLTLGEFAFSGVQDLGPLTIPDGTTSIGYAAFWSCQGMTSVSLPKSLTQIGPLAFTACSDVASFTVDAGNPVYDSRDGCNALIETATNTLVHGFHSTVIPATVTAIGPSAFSLQDNLHRMDIPATITLIDDGAFGNCHQMDTIVCHIAQPLPIGTSTFTSANMDNCRLIVPYGTGGAYATATGWNAFGHIEEMEPTGEEYAHNTLSLYAKEGTDFGTYHAGLGQAVTVPVALFNQGIDTIQTIRYTVERRGQTAEHQMDVEPITYMMRQKLRLPIEAAESVGNDEVTLTITHVNGQENLSDSKSITGRIITVAQKPQVRAVVEEVTGTWCMWCTRGIVGLSLLNRDFADDVITIAVHGGSPDEPMYIAEYDDLMNQISQFPDCLVNREGPWDPYEGSSGTRYGIRDDVEEALQGYSPATISVSAAWTDARHTALTISSAARFVEDISTSAYRMGYVLLEDGLSGTGDEWAQWNALSNDTSDPNFSEVAALPFYVEDMIYDHVPVAAWQPYYGVEGTLPDAVEAGTEYSHQFEADLTANSHVQSKDRLTVVALLIDSATGKVVNGAKVRVPATDDPDGVQAIQTTASGTFDVHDVSGRLVRRQATTLQGLPRGVYIVSGRKVVVR